MPDQLYLGAERLAEQVGLSGCVSNFDLWKRRGIDADPKSSLERPYLDSRDGLGMGAVQPLGDPKNSAQPGDEPAIRPIKVGQVLVSLPGKRLAVIAHHIRDQL